MLPVKKCRLTFTSMKLQVEKFTFNPFQENSYVLYSESGDAVIIDPGCYEREEELALSAFISEKQLNVLAILGTHAHIDHILGNDFAKRTYDAPYYLHQDDLEILQAGHIFANLYGFNGFKRSPDPDYYFTDGETVEFGSIQLKVMHTPGHAPGHVVFYNADNQLLINGDVLFRGSFGRVDLPGGNIEQLKHSICEVLFKLPDDTVVYSGHGPETFIGIEKKSNPILHY